jgi:MoaA/NifB/PqqE/SkfB family radical SAM enzyme
MRASWDQIYRRLYEGINYRMRTFAGGRFASHCRPTSVVLLLTELCNARCVHCDIWKNRGKENSPTAEQWKQVLIDLRRWLGPVHVTFTGGEALLKPHTIELVEHAHKLGLFLEVLTHGYWPDQRKIEKLALARPRRVTISLDGIGETHTRIRGRDNFFDMTSRTIATFQRMRTEHALPYMIRLKTVIMEQNLDSVCDVVRFGKQDGMENVLQPIEQNYNTTEDARWFETSPNWPRDVEKAIDVVRELMLMKRQGYHIGNSDAQLEAMIPYFRDPDTLRVSTQSHTAHERRLLCAALTMLQLQANGDVTVCSGAPPVGNIKDGSIRDIWERRARLWEQGCCLERRLTPREKEARSSSVAP